jgi:hypothetical protein
MKISLALKPRRDLSRSEARGCLTANLLVPGSGSLVAGRAIGYLQLAFALTALTLTLYWGAQFLGWTIKNWSRMRQPSEDPFENLLQLWLAARWPLLGMGLFVSSVLFALVTSLQIMSATPKTPAGLPPRLG